LKIFRFF